MRITNKFHLPETIRRANDRRNANYSSNADRSVTQLINPPRIDILRKAHFTEMEKDLSEDFFALFGSAVHQILEWGNDGNTVEERLYATVAGWVISGAIDLQRDKDADAYDIIDYKVTTAYAVMKEQDAAKPEWEEQLNCYAFLAWLNKGIEVKGVAICAIVRDWNRRSALADPLYPQSPIVMLRQPLWSRQRQEDFIRERVAVHQHAQMLWELGEPMPECSTRDRWVQGEKWAVKKPNAKRALKTFSDENLAKLFAEEQKTEVVIEHRPGRSVRCGFCGVSGWCEQYKAMKDEERGGTDDE